MYLQAILSVIAVESVERLEAKGDVAWKMRVLLARFSPAEHAARQPQPNSQPRMDTDGHG
jgi:hypothetical protein